jgi:hypothetical protein
VTRAAARKPAVRSSGTAGTRPAAHPLVEGIWFTMCAALWVAALVGAIWGLRQLEGHARALHANVTCRLELMELPLWLQTPENRWVLGEIEQFADLRADDSILDEQLCTRVGTGLQNSPWVAAVTRVAKYPDGRVQVWATYREPLAVIEQRGRAYLVDREGVRLLPEYAADTPGLTNSLFMITGASGSLPAVKQPWNGKDVAAGLKLARFLREAHVRDQLPFRSSLGTIDVSHRSGSDILLHIQTYPGCYIDWGLPPGEEYSVDTATANRKLELLNTLYAAQGQFPERIIVVRWTDGVQTFDPRHYVEEPPKKEPPRRRR